MHRIAVYRPNGKINVHCMLGHAVFLPLSLIKKFYWQHSIWEYDFITKT